MNDITRDLQRIAGGDGSGVLAEIIETSGSTPRKAGARMLLHSDGSLSGTVGGGVLEFHAAEESRRLLHSGQEAEHRYSIGGASRPGEDLGGICGGDAVLRYRLIDAARASQLLAECPPAPRVLLYGAGHVGKALADLLAVLDIRVSVTDDRAFLLTPERFPHAGLRLHTLDDAPMAPEPGDMIVIMTHGHSHDYALLRRAMDTCAGYIGVMASRVKAAAFRQRLRQDGFSEEELSRRLHSPIGLMIHAETPEEIAVSIAAELIGHIRTTTPSCSGGSSS